MTQNISVFALSDGGATATLLEQVPLKSTGTNDAFSLDPSGRWLYVIGEHDDIDSPRPEGIHADGSFSPAPLKHNYMDAYSVNQTTGALKEIATVVLPVPTKTCRTAWPRSGSPPEATRKRLTSSGGLLAAPRGGARLRRGDRAWKHHFPGSSCARPTG